MIPCGWCGHPGSVPVLANPAESHGHVTDYLPLCSAHRTQMKRLMGSPPSPGRPPKLHGSSGLSGSRQPKVKHRALKYHDRGYSAAPEVSAPRMPSSRSAAPERPVMPRPGP